MLVEENNYLISVNDNLLDMEFNNVNFLFPIKNYSVGFKDYYNLEDIKHKNSYILINRYLDKEGIDNLIKDLKNINENIIGICFNDLGVLEIIKNLKLDLKLIYMNNHNTTNKETINYFLEYVDSVLISTDITKDEIDIILNNTKKPLVLPFFGLIEVMSSRRTLLANFQKEFNLPKNNEVVIKESISDTDFRVIENVYGTSFYKDKYLYYQNIKHHNILFYYINGLNLDKDIVKKIINNEDILNTDIGFLNTKTYYRLKEETK